LKSDFAIVYLARHGETAWTWSGQHTGLTDLPLTEQGERTARRLGDRLRGMTFAKVFTSPLRRARQTCELARFGPVAEIDPDLVEWDYGKYEGRRAPKSAQSARTGTCSSTAAPEAASLSALGYENDLSRPVIRFWNDTRHVDIEPEAAAHARP
jgi:Histidine phosphatase superfamily (branch 1)